MSTEENTYLSIGTLAKLTGQATSAIRFYESVGLVTSHRTSGGQRQFDPSTVQVLKTIAFAKAAGFTLAEISTLNVVPTQGEPLFAHWRALAEKKIVELDEVIHNAEETKKRLRYALDCACTEAEACPLLG
jgi:MerR family redox-sensitive transcriptional activator SoxR